MKKYVNGAFAYAVTALVFGVFYREFTKVYGFTGITQLSFIHAHLFVLGMVMTLVAGLFAAQTGVENQKLWKAFLITYNIGVPLTVLMMFIRGIFQVLGTELSNGISASISGIAGIAHALAGLGLVFFFLALRKALK